MEAHRLIPLDGAIEEYPNGEECSVGEIKRTPGSSSREKKLE